MTFFISKKYCYKQVTIKGDTSFKVPFRAVTPIRVKWNSSQTKATRIPAKDSLEMDCDENQAMNSANQDVARSPKSLGTSSLFVTPRLEGAMIDGMTIKCRKIKYE